MNAWGGGIRISEDDDIQIIGENSPDIMFLNERKPRVRRGSDEGCWTFIKFFPCGAVQLRLHCCLHSSNCQRNALEDRGPHRLPGNMVHRISSSVEENTSSHQSYFTLSNASSTNTQNMPRQQREDRGVYQPSFTVYNDCGINIELSLLPATVNNAIYQSHHSFGNNNKHNSAHLVLQLAASGSSGYQSMNEINSSSNSTSPSTGESSPPCHSSSACSADPSSVLPSLNSNFGLNVPSRLSEIRRPRNVPPSSTSLTSKCNRCYKRKPSRKQRPISYERPDNVMALLRNLSRAPEYQENSLNSTSKRMQALHLCLKLAGAKPEHVHSAGNFVETEKALYAEVTGRTRISKLKAHLRRYGVRESYVKCFIMYIKNELQ